jgi:hypothetical protein
VLLNTPEFSKSEKKKGIYYYQEVEEVKVEEKYEEPIPEITEISLEAVSQESLTEEKAGAEWRAEAEAGGIQEAVEIPPVAAPEKIKIEIPPPQKKEKAPKKKKTKLEGEKAPRLRKSEKRFIEEKIEIEEGEQEALSALKEEEEKEEAVVIEVAEKKEKKEVVEVQAKEEDVTPPSAPGEPSFGFFAEKLKSALTKKGKEEEEDKKK